MPRHHSMSIVLMSMVLETGFIFCSTHTRSFNKTSSIVDTTTPFCSAPAFQQFWTNKMHMSSSKCSNYSPLSRPLSNMDFAVSFANFNFTNSSSCWGNPNMDLVLNPSEKRAGPVILPSTRLFLRNPQEQSEERCWLRISGPRRLNSILISLVRVSTYYLLREHT